MALLGMAGCWGGPGRVAAPEVEIDEFVESLVRQHDANSDGTLSTAELDAATYVQDCLVNCDANDDGQLTRDEIKQRLRKVFDGKLGLMSASCRVTRNGRPVEGAIVYLVPLPGLESELPVAGAVTQASGVGVLGIRPEDLPKNAPKISGLVRPGLYFVEVTHPSIKIPDQYNVKTTLGQEVTPETAGDAYHFALKF
jgi:hypothetical protein